MRRSILPSLLTILENNRRQRDEVRLFEIGKGYHPEHANERGEPKELHRVALALAATPPGKKAGFDEHAFAKLHGVVVDLIDRLGVVAPTYGPASEAPAMAPVERASRCSMTREAQRLFAIRPHMPTIHNSSAPLNRARLT